MTREQLRTGLFIAITALILILFWDSPAVWPLKILVVLFHELGHALAAVLTGGTVLSIGLSPDQGGVTHTSGGWRFAILNAGYLGSLLFGVALLAAGRSPKQARVGVGALSLVLLGATLFWVRPLLSFGFGAAMAFTAASLWLALRAKADLVQLVLRGLGVFSVLYALWDIRSDVFGGTAGVSDASMLAASTWIPPMFWGGLWLAIGVGTLYWTRSWWR